MMRRTLSPRNRNVSITFLTEFRTVSQILKILIKIYLPILMNFDSYKHSNVDFVKYEKVKKLSKFGVV